MGDNLEQLIESLAISPLSNTTLSKIACILDEQNCQTMPSFVSNTLQSLITLEHWSWQVLSQDFRGWVDEQSYNQLFHALYSWNIKLISISDTIQSNTKVTLLIPPNTEWIDGVLDQINTDHDMFLTVASLWFQYLAYFILEQPEVAFLPIIQHMNSRLGRDFVMTDQYKSYLQKLLEPNISQLVFTKKKMFYLKTCSFSLDVYLSSKSQNFPFTSENLLEFLTDVYRQIILMNSSTVDSWNPELLCCIAHLTGLITSLCWWGGLKAEHIEMIIPSKDATHAHILAFIRIVNHQPFQRYVSIPWYHDENILINAILVILMGVIETQNVGYFISSETNLPTTLLTIAQNSPSGRLLLYAYGLLAAMLSNEQLKELRIADNICEFFFEVLEQAWQHPTKRWKKIPIPYLLKGLLNLSTNDTIQTTTAHLKKIPLLIEMCDIYPMTYDILWSLSFNTTIQEQLRSNSSFMTKLAKLGREYTDPNACRSVNGILWLVNSNREENFVPNDENHAQFDAMISYAHKDKQMCKQVYDELIRAGYRIWIDFDQMHGNVIDAMAQAIERSHTIIICMSEHYQRSNFCRAEAQYAFERKLKMVPILLQKQYKPSGWLSFLVSQILYVDFVKYEFSKAIELLFQELKPSHLSCTTLLQPQTNHLEQSNHVISAIQLPQNIYEWTSLHVHQWLTDNNLPQMARILSDVDGRSLIYLNEYIISGEPRQILLSFQQDSLRYTNEILSLVEVARFRSLIEREGFATMTSAIRNNHFSQYCSII